MRKQNIIIFSAGESLRNGRVNYIKNELEKREISCTNWDELFEQAHNKNNIALLPTLVKKIPSFDFALIVAEGVDKTLFRQTENIKSIRDNVIFEIGLCIMGLGVEHVILMSEKHVRLPDDLIGNNGIGIFHIEFQSYNLHHKIEEVENFIIEKSLQKNLDDIAQHIFINSKNVSPVFIGASISLAESYFNNFLIRLTEYLDQPIYDATTHQEISVDRQNIQINIILPTRLNENIRTQIQNYYQMQSLNNYYIHNAGTRHLFFKGKNMDKTLHITDIPTSITASYSVVNTILNIDSDDNFDTHAKIRFMTKEIDMFEYALSKFLQNDYLEERLNYINDQSKREEMKLLLSNVHIEQKDIS